MQENGASTVLWMIISIILVRHLYLKGLNNPPQSTMSNLIFTFILLTCVNSACLGVLSIEGTSTLQMIELGQKIIDSFQFALSIPEVI